MIAGKVSLEITSLLNLKYTTLTKTGDNAQLTLLEGLESSITFLEGNLAGSIRISLCMIFSPIIIPLLRIFPAGNLTRFTKPEHCYEAWGVHCFVVCDNEKRKQLKCPLSGGLTGLW